MQRVKRELEASGANDRRANFTCALALAAPGRTDRIFEGKVFGTLVWPPRGRRGFGYDPIFVPDGYSETFGEMEPAKKNALSHRMRAFEKLIVRPMTTSVTTPSASMCIGRSAAPNARIATSIRMSGMAASTRRASSPPISASLNILPR